MKRTILAVTMIMLAAALAPAAATAADGWQFAITPYLWGAGVNGTAKVRSHEADVEKSFSDILKDLDFAAMVDLQARKGRFGLYGDVVYLGLSDTNKATTPGGATLLQAKTTLDSWIVDFGGSWEAARWGDAAPGKGGFLDIIAGGRYWSIDTEIEASTPLLPGGGRSVEKSGGWVDPVVGARLAANLTPKLTLIARGDVGGFDLGDCSKLTWTASGYLGWHFSPLVAAWAGYKHLEVERESDRENSVDLAFSGPVLGVSFSF